MSGANMKKAVKKASGRAGKAATKRRASASRREPPMRAEYDFSGAVRGKYAKLFAAGSNVVVLEPDVAKAFPTAKAVNAALRANLESPGKRGSGSKRRTA